MPFFDEEYENACEFEWECMTEDKIPSILSKQPLTQGAVARTEDI